MRIVEKFVLLSLLLIVAVGAGESSWASEAAPSSRCRDSLAVTVQPFIIGVAGGSASGKTTLAHRLAEELASENVLLISQDWYFLPFAQPKEYFINGHPNFDHPTAMDFPLMKEHLAALQAGRGVEAPDYDFNTAERMAVGRKLRPAKIIIFEGIHALNDAELRAQMDLTIFVAADADVRLGRRIRRDVQERGKDADSVLRWYFEMVKPMHDTFIEPSKAFADVVLDGEDSGKDTAALIALIKESIAAQR